MRAVAALPAQSAAEERDFWFGFLVNELPFLAGLVLVASTVLAAAQGDLVTPSVWWAPGSQR